MYLLKLMETRIISISGWSIFCSSLRFLSLGYGSSMPTIESRTWADFSKNLPNIIVIMIIDQYFKMEYIMQHLSHRFLSLGYTSSLPTIESHSGQIYLFLLLQNWNVLYILIIITSVVITPIIIVMISISGWSIFRRALSQVFVTWLQKLNAHHWISHLDRIFKKSAKSGMYLPKVVPFLLEKIPRKTD